MSVLDHLKKTIWLIIYPIFPISRNILRKIGYSPYPKRQEFPLGFLQAGKTADELFTYLQTKGFVINKVAWIDDGEILSVRKIENFHYQYHLRLFNDMEIRGHHELTPEYSPFGHLHDKETTSRTDEFKEILGDWLV